MSTTTALAAVMAVFDGLLKKWDGEVYASEWTRAFADLEKHFLNPAIREDRRRAFSNGIFVARSAGDWEQLVGFLWIDPLGMHHEDYYDFFGKCPLGLLTDFIAGEKGMFNLSLTRLSTLEVLAGNDEDNICLLHMVHDGLFNLGRRNSEWKERHEKGTDLLKRMCLLKGGVPQPLLLEKFNRTLGIEAPSPNLKRNMTRVAPPRKTDLNPTGAKPFVEERNGRQIGTSLGALEALVGDPTNDPAEVAFREQMLSAAAAEQQADANGTATVKVTPQAAEGSAEPRGPAEVIPPAPTVPPPAKPVLQ
mgnify:CR=1 FL=1